MTSLRDKLKSELQEVEWSALRSHSARDAIITVSQELELAEVAERIAEDDKAQVASWIQQGHLAKPSAEELAHWEKEPNLKFYFLIVSPFVLIQRVAH